MTPFMLGKLLLLFSVSGANDECPATSADGRQGPAQDETDEGDEEDGGRMGGALLELLRGGR
jgi:hypothetical protein